MARWNAKMLNQLFLRCADMCAWCVYMWHIRHMGDFRIFFEKIRFFRIFVEFQKFSKNFPKFFLVKNQQNIVSFRLYENRSKIRHFRAYWYFSNFWKKIVFLRFLKNFQKSKNFKMLKWRILLRFCSNEHMIEMRRCFVDFWQKKILENFLKNFGIPQTF